MKKISVIRFYVILLFLSVFGVSCQKSALDTLPKGVLVEGISNSTTVDKLVIAAYNGLSAHFFGNAEAFEGPSSNWVLDVASDDAYKGGGGITDETNIAMLETATEGPTNGVAENKWRNDMFAIARCNLAIKAINNLKDNSYPKTERIAEMRFLRGLFYFDMIRIFHNVPWIDENSDPTKVSNTALSYSQVMSKIEADLQYAYKNLPPTQSDVGRATKYAAASYLANLYLTTKEYQKAIDMCNVIMQGPFHMLSDFQKTFTVQENNGPDVIFSIQYSTANIYANHDWSDLLNVTTSPGISAGGYANGDDFYLGSQNLVNAFRTDANGLPLFNSFNDVIVTGSYSGNLDPRVDFTFGRNGIPWKGNTAIYTTAQWLRSSDYAPGFSCKKHIVAPNYPGINMGFPWAAAGLNFILVRYAQVLLWKAEAEIDLNQNLDDARNLINQVRERAKNSPYVTTLDGSRYAANYKIGLYPATGWTQAYALQAVRFEERLELAMEGKRWFELQRWGIIDAVMNAYYQSEASRVSYLKGATFNSFNEYLPIPQQEIDLAPDLYKQNPSY